MKPLTEIGGRCPVLSASQDRVDIGYYRACAMWCWPRSASASVACRPLSLLQICP